MSRYRQLSSDEHVQIATLRYQNISLPKIARIVGRHRSKVRRNRAPYDGGSRSARAHERAVARRGRSRRNQLFSLSQIVRVEALLRQQWSPGQVAGWLEKQELRRWTVVHDPHGQAQWSERQRQRGRCERRRNGCGQ